MGYRDELPALREREAALTRQLERAREEHARGRSRSVGRRVLLPWVGAGLVVLASGLAGAQWLASAAAAEAERRSYEGMPQARGFVWLEAPGRDHQSAVLLDCAEDDGVTEARDAYWYDEGELTLRFEAQGSPPTATLAWSRLSAPVALDGELCEQLETRPRTGPCGASIPRACARCRFDASFPKGRSRGTSTR